MRPSREKVGPFEVLAAEPGGDVGLVELARAPPRVPLQLETGQGALEPPAVDAIGAQVGARAGGDLDRRARHRLGHDLGQLADAVVLAGAADVPGAVVHDLTRRCERRDEDAADVLDVDDRTPRRAVREQLHLAGGERPGHQVVEHEIEAQERRDAVRGRVAQRGGAEAIARRAL